MCYIVILIGCVLFGLFDTQSYAINRRQLKEKKAPMILESYAFKDGDKIPTEYTCDDPDLPMSPPLKWINAPAHTKSFALTCVDIDALRGNFVHWVVFNIPADIAELPEQARIKEIGGTEGLNGWKEVGYGSLCPPLGKHRYIFKLYALDILLNLDHKADYSNLLNNIHGHVLETATIMGTYQKNRRG